MKFYAAVLGLLLCACAHTSAEQSSAPAPTTGVADSTYDLETLSSKPELLNREQFIRAIEARYPPDLKDRGIGGTVRLTLILDTDGQVAEARVAETSTLPAIDQAAVEVARSMRFTPGRIGATPVRTRITLPFTFSMKQK